MKTPRRVGDDPGQTHEEYEREYMPRLKVSGQDNSREGESHDRLIDVYEGHQLSAVEVIYQQPANRTDEQDGQRVQTEGDAGPEGGVGDFVGQPAHDNLLEPETTGGEHGCEPDEDVVAVPERVERMEASAYSRGADARPVHPGEHSATSRSARLDRLRLQLDGPGQFRLRGLDRDKILDLVESGFRLTHRFRVYKPGHILGCGICQLIRHGDTDETGYIRRLDIGIGGQVKRTCVSVRRLRMIHRVHGMNVVAARI